MNTIETSIIPAGLDQFLGFSACPAQQATLYCSCKNGKIIDQAWFRGQKLDTLSRADLAK